MSKIEVAAGAQPAAMLRQIALISMQSGHINFFICAIFSTESVVRG